MKKHLIYIGNQFLNNRALQEYVQREVEDKVDLLNIIEFYSENDKSLFLELEKVLETNNVIIIVTSKSSYPTVSKLLCTITADNMVLKDQLLVPEKSLIHEQNTYLLQHVDTYANVIMVDLNEEFPTVLLQENEKAVKINLFDEDLESAKALLEPLIQTYDVRVEYTQLVSGWILLTINSKRYNNISHFVTSAKKLLATKLITQEEIIPMIIDKLKVYKKKITIAESCTGGFLAYMFTKHSGASTIFEGSLITYSNEIKSNWLGVKDKLFEEHGAVSAEVVEEMSDGALNVAFADYAIAISGIAGPTGGEEYKPVGTIFISVRSKLNSNTEVISLKGDRKYIQYQSAMYAIKMLLLLEKETFF
ncbi:MAG: nicotinamide-nucleotide amidohydrolase family protein [Helicobacteraceae bacterium]|nr:nicotinamide-nucleotide amidohydrolase family protein [Helicobacteraceae bacterium]